MDLRLAPDGSVPLWRSSPEAAVVPALAPLAVRACFGVVCPRHGQCARYAAVNQSAVDPLTLVTCREGERFPLFIAIVVPRASVVA